MTQIIFVQNDTWNSEVVDFITRMQSQEKTQEQMIDLLYKYADVYNVKLETSRKFSIECINNCALIYRGLDHVLTLKFEL